MHLVTPNRGKIMEICKNKNCKAEKQKDGYKTCPDCREYWRLAQRKPTGNAYKLEILTEKYKRLQKQYEQLKQSVEKCV